MAQALTMRTLKDVPALRQIFSLLLVAGAVAAGIAIYMWGQKPDYTPLFSNLSDKDAAEMADALRSANIEYQINTGSGTVSVAASKIAEARLKLASQGLPRGGDQGFEMIQQEQGLGTSQLIEGARYQHALETELARTISGLQPIAGARVHLALPKPSAFSRDNVASASVFVELRGGRTLEQEQVASIVHLVASSVPNLAAESVSVVDQSGRLLTRSGANPEMASVGEQYDYGRRIERDYSRRIEQLLLPMMGPGRVNAQVAADIDLAVTEEARESYTPNPQAVRSEQSSENSNSGNSVGAQGIPGATSNQPPAAVKAATPPGAAGAPSAATVTTQSREMTRNYELDKTLRHTRQAGGGIKRLSVAVLVDNRPKLNDKGEVTLTPLTTEELTKVEALVKEAVGFNAQRGDTVSVQNSAFLQPEALQPPPEPAIWEKPEMRDLARSALGTLTLLVMFITILRPLLKSLMSAPVTPQMPAIGSAGGGMLTADIAEDRVSFGGSGGGHHQQALPAYEEKLQAARAAVTQDPKRVAQVVKNWVGSEQ